jgi:hypothetical protein
MNGRLYTSTDVIIDATSIIIETNKSSITTFGDKYIEIINNTNELINHLKRTILNTIEEETNNFPRTYYDNGFRNEYYVSHVTNHDSQSYSWSAFTENTQRMNTQKNNNITTTGVPRYVPVRIYNPMNSIAEPCKNSISKVQVDNDKCQTFHEHPIISTLKIQKCETPLETSESTQIPTSQPPPMNYNKTKTPVIPDISFSLFYDYQFPEAIPISNVLFYDYIPRYIDYSLEEQLKSTPYIDNSKIYSGIDDIKKNIICKFEFDNCYNSKLNPSNMYPVSKLEILDSQKIECLNLGWMRYLITRGGKMSTKKERKERGELLSFDNAQIQNLENSVLQYSFYMLPDMLMSFSEIPAYGCNIEADFAIAKYVRLKMRNIYPLICSNDSDMLMLLNDVNCSVRLLRNSVEYFVNPVLFWKSIFRCVLPYDVIIILCILKGTDYNKYTENSPIHIDRFEDILQILNVPTYSKITFDLLINYLQSVFQKFPTALEVKETSLALNIYLQYMSFESCFKEIEKRKMDLDFIQNKLIEQCKLRQTQLELTNVNKSPRCVEV